MGEPVRLLIRTWNIAHARDVAPRGDGYAHLRRKHLGHVAELAAAEGPDVVLLQEVPVWAGPELRERTGMAITLAPTYGAHVPFVHVPLPLAVGAAVGRALPDLVRTQVEGQAQALLYASSLLLVSARRVWLTDRKRFRGEPRAAQLVRLRHRRSGRELVVANVHADWHMTRRQLEKAGYVLERFARGAPMILAGDFNAGVNSAPIRALRRRGWVENSGDTRIDHVLVQGLEIEWPATRWLPERRDVELADGRRLRLSDHDPVDCVVALP